jgi:hypothetical protein
MFVLETPEDAVSILESFPDSHESLSDICKIAYDNETAEKFINGTWLLSSEAELKLACIYAREFNIHNNHLLELVEVEEIGEDFAYCYLPMVKRKIASYDDLRSVNYYLTNGITHNGVFFTRAEYLLSDFTKSDGSVCDFLVRNYQAALGRIGKTRPVMCPLTKDQLEKLGVEYSMYHDGEAQYKEITSFVKLLIVIGIALESGYTSFIECLEPAISSIS